MLMPWFSKEKPDKANRTKVVAVKHGKQGDKAKQNKKS